ncbi:protein kinase [Candidatus Riflebacteria bacterium]
MNEESQNPELEKLFLEAKKLERDELPIPAKAFLTRFIDYFDKKQNGETIRYTSDPEKNLFSYYPLFKSISIFGCLPEDLLLKIIHTMEKEHYARGDKIIRKGDEGNSLYIVLEGKVEALVPKKENVNNPTVILGPGQIFGEMALLTPFPRTVDILAFQQCIVASLRKRIFKKLCDKFPEVGDLLTALVSKRLGTTEDKIIQKKVKNYKILESLGRGGAGIVFKGEDTKIHRPVALKMLHHKMIFNEEHIENFLAEARMISRLNHPNIVRLYEVADEFATYFLVMEYLDGQTLKSILAEKKVLEITQAIDIIEKIGSALSHAWEQGTIHKDIKPANIMIGKTGEIKLLDFGSAILKDFKEESEFFGKVFGTLGYMSPEQAQGKEINYQSDIYSFGIVCFEMLTGKRPFKGRNLSTIVLEQMYHDPPKVSEENKEVPTWLDNFVYLCMQPRLENRIDSFKQVLATIRKIKFGKISVGGRIRLQESSLPGMERSMIVEKNPWRKKTWKDFFKEQKSFKKEQLGIYLAIFIFTLILSRIVNVFL